MLFFYGNTVETTNELAGSWCGDLLEITDDLSKQLHGNFRAMYCCFAEAENRANYCLRKFGLDENNFIKANQEGDLFEAVRESVIRCIPTEWYNLKVEHEEGEAKLIPVPVEC